MYLGLTYVAYYSGPMRWTSGKMHLRCISILDTRVTHAFENILKARIPCPKTLYDDEKGEGHKCGIIYAQCQNCESCKADKRRTAPGCSTDSRPKISVPLVVSSP